MKSFDELLPIGSVILLKDGEKRLMITGICQYEEEDNTIYDYIGVLYPEGNLGEDSRFLFNHEDIDRIYFYGFNDIERQEFVKALHTEAEKNAASQDDSASGE